MPAAGFTQRATIDPDKDEIHVLSVSNVLTNIMKCFDIQKTSVEGAEERLCRNLLFCPV